MQEADVYCIIGQRESTHQVVMHPNTPMKRVKSKRTDDEAYYCSCCKRPGITLICVRIVKRGSAHTSAQEGQACKSRNQGWNTGCPMPLEGTSNRRTGTHGPPRLSRSSWQSKAGRRGCCGDQEYAEGVSSSSGPCWAFWKWELPQDLPECWRDLEWCHAQCQCAQ